VVKAAFNVEQGQTSPVSPTAKGLFVVQVDGVTPSHVKPLEEVKTLVQAAWLEDKRAEMASAKASTLMEALGKGESVSGLERTTAIGRDGADRGQLDQTAVAGIFATKPGEVLTSKTQEGTWVIRVAEIKPAALEGVDLAPVRDSLKEQMANDLLEQYGAALRTGYGVTLNEAWLGQTASE
jgi:peptidyl-prolyl cis-trans isomerase D